MKTEIDQKPVMVCVTRQRTCERLIHAGAQLAQQMETNLMVVNAVCSGQKVLGSKDSSAAMEMLFQAANEHNAKMVVFECKDAFEGLAQCAREHQAETMVLGSSPENATQVLQILKEKLPKMNFIVLEAEQEAKSKVI